MSKHDVSTAAKVIRERGLTFDAISSMNADAISVLFTPKGRKGVEQRVPPPDIAGLVERKKRCRKLPVKLFWIKCCERVEAEGKMAYAYQTFCDMLAQVAEKMGTIRHFIHESEAKCYIGWVGVRPSLPIGCLGRRRGCTCSSSRYRSPASSGWRASVT